MPARKPTRKPARAKTIPARKAGVGASRARAQDATGRSFLSASQSPARTDLMLPRPRDFRKDFTGSNRLEMMSRMRYLERNFGLKRQIVSDFVTYVVGHGQMPMSGAQDSEVGREHVAYFLAWAKRCDLTGRFSYWDVQKLAQRRKFTDGDFFVAPIKTEDGYKLQLIEAHRVCSPYEPGKPRKALSDDGVNYDRFGRVVSYTVQLDDGTYQDIDAANLIHFFSPEWSTGSRGLPRLQHSWNDAQDLMEHMALEKQAIKLHSEFSITLKNTAPGFLDAQAKEMSEGGPACAADLIQDVRGGKIIAGPNGQDVDLKQSMRPNSNFTAYIDHLKRDVAMASIPYEFVGDASKLGSVGVRLIGAKASRVFATEMEEMADRLNTPIYALVIGDAIARGLLREDPKWDSVSWTGPKDVTLDAGRDARNDREAIAAGLMSFTEYYRINAGDFKAGSETLADDYAWLFELERKKGLPAGILSEGLRKGSTAPSPAETEPSAGETEDSPEDVQEDADEESMDTPSNT